MAEDDASGDANARLVERLEHLERVLQANTQRLHAVEQRLRLDTAPPPRTEPRRPLYESVVDERDETADDSPPPAGAGRDTTRETQTPPRVDPSPRVDPPPRAAPPPPRAAAPPPPPRATHAGAPPPRTGAPPRFGAFAARRDLESLIGGVWFNWVGIIVLTFGVAFFLRHAFQNEWVGPTGRVALGAVAGLAVLVFADLLRARGLRQYAFVLSGGGVLILYLSIYAAFNFYQLIAQPVAFRS